MLLGKLYILSYISLGIQSCVIHCLYICKYLIVTIVPIETFMTIYVFVNLGTKNSEEQWQYQLIQKKKKKKSY